VRVASGDLPINSRMINLVFKGTAAQAADISTLLIQATERVTIHPSALK